MHDALVVGAALHVYQLAQELLVVREVELHGDQGRVVLRLPPLVREVLGLEAAGAGELLHAGQRLSVRRVPALAVHPDLVLGALLPVPASLEVGGPVVVCEVGLVDGHRVPAPDLVELEEDAGRHRVPDVVVGEGAAGSELCSVEGLVVFGGVAVDLHELLGSLGVVHVEVPLAVRGGGQVVGVGILEHEHVGVYPGVSVQRPDAHACTIIAI